MPIKRHCSKLDSLWFAKITSSLLIRKQDYLQRSPPFLLFRRLFCFRPVHFWWLSLLNLERIKHLFRLANSFACPRSRRLGRTNRKARSATYRRASRTRTNQLLIVIATAVYSLAILWNNCWNHGFYFGGHFSAGYHWALSTSLQARLVVHSCCDSNISKMRKRFDCAYNDVERTRFATLGALHESAVSLRSRSRDAHFLTGALVSRKAEVNPNYTCGAEKTSPRSSALRVALVYPRPNILSKPDESRLFLMLLRVTWYVLQEIPEEGCSCYVSPWDEHLK